MNKYQYLEELYAMINNLYVDYIQGDEKVNTMIFENRKIENNVLDFLEMVENHANDLYRGLISCEQQEKWEKEGLLLLNTLLSLLPLD